MDQAPSQRVLQLLRQHIEALQEQAGMCGYNFLEEALGKAVDTVKTEEVWQRIITSTESSGND